MLVVICLGMAAFAGLGLQALLELQPRWPRARTLAPGWALLGVGAAALMGVIALGLVLAAQDKGVDGLLPAWQGNIGFWVLVAGLSLLAALCFVAAGGAGPRTHGSGRGPGLPGGG